MGDDETLTAGPWPPMATAATRFDVLPAAQRQLWPQLAAVPRSFVLYGGTAPSCSRTLLATSKSRR